MKCVIDLCMFVIIPDITESLWSPAQCRVVLEALNHILYQKLGFRGNQDDYYDPQNSYINRVSMWRGEGRSYSTQRHIMFDIGASDTLCLTLVPGTCYV